MGRYQKTVLYLTSIIFIEYSSMNIAIYPQQKNIYFINVESIYKFENFKLILHTLTTLLTLTLEDYQDINYYSLKMSAKK